MNTQSETQLFDMLLKQRIDTAILSIYTFAYLSKNNQHRFYIAKKEHDSFTRHLFVVGANRTSTFTQLDTHLNNNLFNKEWKERLHNYTIPVN